MSKAIKASVDVTFTQSSARTNISSGENISTSFGKIKKWLADLGTAAFTDSSQYAAASHTHEYIPLSGSNSITGSLKFTQSGRGVYLVDKEGFSYPGIIDNGANLWIGGTGTNSKHHTGVTYISTGYDSITQTGNSTIKVFVPNETNTGGTGYDVLHNGNTSFTRSYSSGTKIGSISIDDSSTDIYIPTATDMKVTQNISTTSIATKYPLLISAYEKDSTTTTATSVSRIQNIYAQPSTGTLYATKFNGDGSALTNVPHSTIDVEPNTGSVEELQHGSSFTAISSVTKDANGHVTKYNLATYTLPTSGNTDAKVKQENTTTTEYRPLALGYTSSTDPSSLDPTVTNQIYLNSGLYAQASSGTLFAKNLWMYNDSVNVRTGLTNTSLRMNVKYTGSSGATFNNTVHVVRTYPGKITDTSSMLLTVTGNGLTIVGGGESPSNLANLIDDDQTTSNPNKLLLAPNGTWTTTVNGSSEMLLLSSDQSIFFLTNCNTVGDRVAVALDKSKQFFPDATGTGSLGTSSYHWKTAYIDTTYGDLEGNVKHTATNPTTSTTYGITFHASPNSDNTNKALRTSDGVRYAALEGTSSNNGYGILIVGNNVASGTAGNKYGRVRIYSKSTYYGEFTLASSITANRTYTFPDKTGTVAMTSDLPTDSGQLTLTIPSNVNINTSSKLYYRKYGPVVYVYGMIKMADDVTGPSGTIATLPTGYRPPEYNIDTCVGCGSTDASANLVLFRIATNGNIILIPGSNGTFSGTGKLVSGSEIRVHAMFMVS